MSVLGARERGDMAEQLLPVAAHLAVLVHGDGGPEDVQEVLAGLDDAQRTALIVVLAGLVDPEQPMSKALGWLDFNEHGQTVVPVWGANTTVRDLSPEPELDDDEPYVDQVAVTRFVKGLRVADLADEEFMEAVRQCAAMGMTCSDINLLRRWPADTAENWVNRLRKRYERSGRVFPDLGLPKPRVFTEEEVVAMRVRSHEGATDLQLAMSFGTSTSVVGSICRGRTYRQYGGPVRAARNAKGMKTSREFMCGHADSSQAAAARSDVRSAA